MKNDVVVTSYGIISSIGLNAEDFKKNLFAGASGVTEIRGQLVPENFPVHYAAWVPREKLGPSTLFKGQDTSDILKSWLMTELASLQALKSLKPTDKIDAIVFGTADGASYEIVEGVLKQEVAGVPKTDRPEFDYNKVKCESSLDIIKNLVVHEGFAPVADKDVVSLNSACATGNQTIGIAYQGIKAGRWNRCLVGGVDARCEGSNFLNFFHLGALTTADLPPEKASRPFAKDRSGFVRGEGAAVLILESRESAEARGAKILGVISGYGCTSDAYRLTDGREDGASVIQAMKEAVETAKLKKEEISYINAHGTSTPLNDRLETFSIKSLFGEQAYKIPVSSLKSQIGHATIASSSIEAIACLMMLEEQTISPTINYENPDPECDLDYVPNVSRKASLKHILSNSFGFGGQNTCTVISKDMN